MAFIACAVAVYSIIDQNNSAKNSYIFQTELNKKADTLRNQSRELETANKKIVKLQSDNLDSASRIIAEQSRLLAKSIDILELSNENSKHLMGNGAPTLSVSVDPRQFNSFNHFK
jgi:septal ring factor EnvC (AmiA/AmiB activator)